MAKSFRFAADHNLFDKNGRFAATVRRAAAMACPLFFVLEATGVGLRGRESLVGLEEDILVGEGVGQRELDAAY